MKPWIWALIIVAIVVILFYSMTSRAAIKNYMDNANYCSVDEDCTIVYASFSCGEYINVNEVDSINFWIGLNRYGRLFQIQVDCMMPVKPSCENNICVKTECEIGQIINQTERFNTCSCTGDKRLRIINNSELIVCEQI